MVFVSSVTRSVTNSILLPPSDRTGAPLHNVPVSIVVESRSFLSRQQAAELLGVSERTVDRLRQRGLLRPVQLVPRGRVRYRLADVQALLEPELRGPHPARADELEWA